MREIRGPYDHHAFRPAREAGGEDHV